MATGERSLPCTSEFGVLNPPDSELPSRRAERGDVASLNRTLGGTVSAGTLTDRGEIVGERSVRRSCSRPFLRRVARRQAAALSLASFLLLLVTAAALAVTGDLTQPAGTAGCVSNDGTGH